MAMARTPKSIKIARDRSANASTSPSTLAPQLPAMFPTDLGFRFHVEHVDEFFQSHIT
jgi:hypothetical protein